MHGQHSEGLSKGPNTIVFSRQKIAIPAAILIRGIMFGDRYVEFGDKMTFVDEANALSCELV